MLKLNLGCGESKLEGFVNVDCEPTTTPDLLHNIITERLPYDDNSVDEIWMIHALEHIEYRFWEKLLLELARVLKSNGTLLLTYPEFSECSKRFLSDYNNQKDFWRATLYGRQLWDSDYHVTPMHSPYVKQLLEPLGFYRINYRSESDNSPYNTILAAAKDPSPCMREDVLVKELRLGISDSIELAGKLG